MGLMVGVGVRLNENSPRSGGVLLLKLPRSPDHRVQVTIPASAESVVSGFLLVPRTEQKRVGGISAPAPMVPVLSHSVE